MSAPAHPAIEFAPAKVNLTLSVGRARADGMHPLNSLVVFADWGDELMAVEADTLTLSLAGERGAALADEKQNLVLKAAYALRAAAEKPELGAALTLTKRLPIAAGLGGGSADAAAALRLLNRVWDIGFSTQQLAEIGTVVGADVPACVHSRPLVMAGIGEKITPLVAWPELPAVIVNPGKAVPTGPVFKAYDDSRPGLLVAARAPVAGKLDDAVAAVRAGRNDLETPAIALEPAVAQTLEALVAAPGIALARMSGSGASCFGLCDSSENARTAAEALSRAHPDWTVKAVTFQAAA
ncbi:4-(cytidine 5'-diphospho)-2-C-methyl-D-erythritol kinase [Maricaulaceae bacterium EIL42A08]|nr:4-(cytidine 5'-diphospho)-2-C-methyl-D-erythritol kinase [Maricaulaceae bacterium EIL42A08]